MTAFENTIGYGGMIHHFKNWVLRPDEPKYRDGAIASAQQALAMLEGFEKDPVLSQLDLSLQAQRATIGSYLDNIDTINRMHLEGATAREIDDAVRINDLDALNELAALRDRVARQMRLDQSRLVDRRNLILALPSVVIVLLLGGLLLLARQRGRLRSEFDTMRVEEMEQFTQIAAHDLRTPLRQISSLAEFALEDMEGGEPVPPEAMRDNLVTIMGRARKLDGLIKAVFRYIQVEGASQEITEVDLRRMIDDLAELHIPEGGSIRLEGEFPTIRAQRVELEIILRNFISNAVKHHPEQKPTVVVRHFREGRQHRFEVEDNGPGIPAEHADKVFQMFWSIRDNVPAEEVSGVGLAVVRRIVNRWGTELSLRNAEPSGAVFGFSVPAM